MITATCKTETCQQANTPYFVLGNPQRVECGHCGASCDLTDLTDDPVQENIPE